MLLEARNVIGGKECKERNVIGGGQHGGGQKITVRWRSSKQRQERKINDGEAPGQSNAGLSDRFKVVESAEWYINRIVEEEYYCV